MKIMYKLLMLIAKINFFFLGFEINIYDTSLQKALLDRKTCGVFLLRRKASRYVASS